MEFPVDMVYIHCVNVDMSGLCDLLSVVCVNSCSGKTEMIVVVR